jgi:hypothetical protein
MIGEEIGMVAKLWRKESHFRASAAVLQLEVRLKRSVESMSLAQYSGRRSCPDRWLSGTDLEPTVGDWG